MNRLIVLDRDGIINVVKEYVPMIEPLEFIPNAINGLKLLQDLNFKLVLITNQSRIGRYYFTEEQHHKFNQYFLNVLKQEGIIFSEVFYCPHDPKEGCVCQKPNIQLFEEYFKTNNINKNFSFSIGDKTSNIKLGENLEIKSILVKTGNSVIDKEYYNIPDYTACNLMDAAKWIKQQEKLKDIEEIKNISTFLKKQSKRVVFTNGCFDILHPGHIRLLRQAHSFGDVLIVGLNTDNSIKRLKGENRPLNPEKNRVEVLSALEDVDYLILFDEDTPHNLISWIQPNVLVKGSDYLGKEIVGADIVISLGGEVRLVDLVEGMSTTNIINKLGERK